MTFTDAAILILRAEGKPLTWRKLAELAVRHDLLTHVGTDPAETMHVRLAESVRRLGERSPFQEGKGGTYALRAWKGEAPGPDASAVAELAGRAAPATPPASPGAAPSVDGAASEGGTVSETTASGRSGRKTPSAEAPASPSGRRRRRGRRGSASKETAAPTSSEAASEPGEAAPAGGGPGPESPPAEPAPASAGTAGEVPVPASAGTAGEGAVPVDAAARTGEGRKRRRRRGRGKGGGAASEASAPAAPSPPASGSRPSSPPPAAPSPAPAPVVSCDLGRLAETALRWLRRSPQRRPLRVAELLAQWSGRNMAEGRLSPASVAAALAAADAGTRVGSSLVGLSGGRWAPAEWAWGEEVAAQERRVGEAAAQHQAALRRFVLRRLAELPLPAFQQIVVALLAAEGFRELRPLDEPAGAESLLLRGRMPYGPAEIPMIVLVVRAAPGRFLAEEQAAALRGRLPRTGACGGAIYTTGRLSDAARRDLVPPNSIPLLAVEHEALVERLLAHRIGIRVRSLELPVPDPELYGTLPEPERG